MKTSIRAVLFDLGNTLMYAPDPWPPVFTRAGQELADFLCEHAITVDCESFSSSFLQRLDEYYSDREHNLMETTTLSLLKGLLAEQGHSVLPEALLRQALDEFYAVTEQNWRLEADALPTLAALQNSGFRLGLVSNAGDDPDVLQLVDHFGIGGFFDFILTSAACGYRKPHPRIFELALENWNCMPDEIAMVGDRLDADIGGARPLGIYTIWIRRRSSETTLNSATPDAVVDTLLEIPSKLSLVSK
ncbi:MAG TPA: HAD family hydrolase [Anaerolineales bacterium]|jgi:putative hydrolase of the HAD superfamily